MIFFGIINVLSLIACYENSCWMEATYPQSCVIDQWHLLNATALFEMREHTSKFDVFRTSFYDHTHTHTYTVSAYVQQTAAQFTATDCCASASEEENENKSMSDITNKHLFVMCSYE